MEYCAVPIAKIFGSRQGLLYFATSDARYFSAACAGYLHIPSLEYPDYGQALGKQEYYSYL